ncbi:MAG: hypothetical protein IH994_05885 [Proteobacteria bacterium]|nr:hypothetical protein [Pseudomonadota bacterium]
MEVGEAPAVGIEAFFEVVPTVDGDPAPLAAWPPLGVTYERMPSLADGELDCIPLVTADNIETELGLCIRSVACAVVTRHLPFAFHR